MFCPSSTHLRSLKEVEYVRECFEYQALITKQRRYEVPLIPVNPTFPAEDSRFSSRKRRRWTIIPTPPWVAEYEWTIWTSLWLCPLSRKDNLLCRVCGYGSRSRSVGQKSSGRFFPENQNPHRRSYSLLPGRLVPLQEAAALVRLPCETTIPKVK